MSKQILLNIPGTAILSAALLLGFQANAETIIDNEPLIKLTYPHFTVLYNCENKGYEHFFYDTVPDTGNFKRKSNFFQEKQLPAKCRQTSTSTYKRKKQHALAFDMGHGANANHFDFSKEAISQTNTMANIIPHASKLNRYGLWRYTDKVVECRRNKHKLTVIGGVIWGNDESNDYFVNTHGVVTPDYLYKIILNKDTGDSIAWIMPNTNEAKKENGYKYIVSINEIEQKTGATFKIDAAKDYIAPKMWRYKKGTCDFS